jgi:hypothetical protein
MVHAHMAVRHRFLGATAVVTLTLQVVMTTAAMLSVCVDRPHTHTGRAAPDCAMHHQQSQAAESHQRHLGHHEGAHRESSGDTTRMTCRCSSDPLSFLVGDIGVVGDRISIRVPTSDGPTITAFTSGTIDLRIPPLSPPPRPVLP